MYIYINILYIIYTIMKTVCFPRYPCSAISPPLSAYDVSKCVSCHKAIVVVTRRAHCFHDYIYIMPILLLCTLYVMNHL